MRGGLRLLVAVILLAACSSEGHDALYLSIGLTGDVTPPTRLVIRAMSQAAEPAQLTTFEESLAGVDLEAERWVVKVVVPSGSTFDGQVLLSVTALFEDTPVASWVDLVDMSAQETLSVDLLPIYSACDLDADGYKNCQARPDCCTKAEADWAHDCWDEDPLIYPFAGTAACRTCSDDDEDGVPDCLQDQPPDLDAVDLNDVEVLDAGVTDVPVDKTDAPGDTPVDTPIDTPVDTPVDVPVDAPQDTQSDIEGDTDCAMDTVTPDEVACQPECPAEGCGQDDGCGGLCGCPEGLECNAGHCVTPGMTLVPGDAYWMGCNEAVQGTCPKEEEPAHLVIVPTFEMDTTEVTNAAWDACVLAQECTPQHYDDGLCSVVDPVELDWIEKVVPEQSPLRSGTSPVVCVDWQQARTFCEQFRCPDCRLCTESEFELAARGGCDLYPDQDCETALPTWPWGGSDPLQAFGLGQVTGNFADESAAEVFDFLAAWLVGYTDGFVMTAPVGSFPAGASPHGLVDLSGNAWEWVRDCWAGNYAGTPSNGDAYDKPNCTKRVRRGGSWASAPEDLRATARGDLPEASLNDQMGFRCCRSITISE